MAVDYSEFKFVVVIDANIALEGPPLPDLPWAEIDPVRPILVVCFPTTLRESIPRNPMEGWHHGLASLAD